MERAMQRRSFFTAVLTIRPMASTALLLALVLSSTSIWAQSEVRFLPEANSASTPDTALAQVLDQGQTLEAQRRWGEALSYYEKALREHPGQPVLEARLDLARLHFDLTRRYNDRSFRHSLTGLSITQVLDQYTEVMVKISSYYVGAPDWRALIDRGTTALDVALEDRLFREQNLPRTSNEDVATFRRELAAHVRQANIQSRHDARRLVAEVAQMGHSRLGLTPAAVVLEYLCGATSGLDPYSAYLTADQLREVYSQIDGNFVGLGVELKTSDGALLLVNIITGSPAERSGLVAGEKIIAVDGFTTAKLHTDEAAARLQGAEGTTVEVTVKGLDGQVRNVRVRREHVEVPSIESTAIIDQDYGIGYFKLTSFQKTTVRDLDAALWNLHRQGMRSLVIDLRGNPGGLLTASVEASDRFLTGGGIVSTKGRNPQEDFNYAAHKPGTWQVPLVVLIDGDSASASEIFAGAMRDNRRATLVGARSYGKGSVQGIFPLSQGGAGVRLTTASFYSPQGRPISKVGVQPDIVVRHAYKATDGGVSNQAAGKDATLEAAVRAARSQLASR